MRGYDWTTVTLGRHCHAGGCGEQLDLWNEGRTSEFSQFGMYFKVRRAAGPFRSAPRLTFSEYSLNPPLPSPPSFDERDSS